jgi:aryl-alcohol dehydrogenase-like predicted oxidoreductase
MQMVDFGKTGYSVSRLGAGLAEIGSELDFDDVEQAGNVLNNALDMGINFLDTAACYGISEELIGRTVADRRDEYVLVTKAGHARGDSLRGRDWTYETVRDSIDRSLRRLNTDCVDLVQLHSCGISELEDGDIIRALEDARDAGKTRLIGYSGDNEAAHWAVDSGVFDTLQTSFNLVEQRAYTTGLLDKCAETGIGVIVKRPIAGATWGMAKSGFSSSRRGYDNTYLDRSKKVQSLGEVPGDPDDPIVAAMGFTLAHPEIHVAIIGTKNPRHMASNIKTLDDALNIDETFVEVMHSRFAELDDGWQQLT